MRYVLVLLLCAFGSSGLAQNTPDSVYWNKQRVLSWADFLGKPENEPIIGARTFTSIRYKLLDYDTSCRVLVRCVFLPRESWTRTQHATEYGLKHEQLHFDISELFARKLRQAYCNYKYNHETVHT